MKVFRQVHYRFCCLPKVVVSRAKRNSHGETSVLLFIDDFIVIAILGASYQLYC